MILFVRLHLSHTRHGALEPGTIALARALSEELLRLQGGYFLGQSQGNQLVGYFWTKYGVSCNGSAPLAVMR